MKPATINEATAPAPVWRQAGESTFLPIDHLKVKIPKAPSACPQEIGAPNWNERWIPDSRPQEPTAEAAIDAVIERIIKVESDGDPTAKNKRSSATGLGQFLDETWLDMISAHRPDLAKGCRQAEILELRRDAKVASKITAR